MSDLKATELLVEHTANENRLALRPREAARMLSIGTRKLWKIAADKTSGIPHCRFGKCIVYPIRELAEWLKREAEKR